MSDDKKLALSYDQRRILHRTARLVGYKIRRGYARELRKNLTPAEKRLWQELHPQQTGGKGWRRQHIIDRFIVDFVYLGSKVVVEADGGYHLDADQKVIETTVTRRLKNTVGKCFAIPMKISLPMQ